MRLISCIMTLSVALLIPATTRAQSWHEYRPEGIGFRVEMPGKPKLETRQTPAGASAYHAVVRFHDLAFLVAYGAKDERKNTDVESTLDTAIKAMIEDKKVLSSKRETLGGFPARRVLLEDVDKDRFEIRVVATNNRMIQAWFIGPAGNALGRRFLDSLALVDQ